MTRFRHSQLRLASVLAIAAALGGSPVAAQAQEPAIDHKRLDAVADWYLGAPIVGMTVAVSRGDADPAVIAYGHTDPGRAHHADARTVHEIGSITKTFTAALVLRRVEQGRIDLEDTVERLLPELAGSAPGVTVRHLLSHTSGLVSTAPSEDLTRPVRADDLIAFMRTGPREFEPGARFRYNNNGYALLGLILEREAGQPYAEQLGEDLLTPLRLNDTAPCRFDDPSRPYGFDHGYRTEARPALHVRHHPDASGAAGLLCSTAADLVRWQSALMGGRVLGAATLALMVEAQTLTDGRRSPYGLGIYVDEDGDRLHHGGAASGFITQMAWRPKDRLGVVVLTNGIYSGALVERLEQDLARVAGGEAWTAPVDLPMSEGEAHALTGAYLIGPARLDVFVMDGHLRARPDGQVATRLLHQGGGRFRAEHDPDMALTFTPDGAVHLEKGGRALPPGRRAP